MYMIDFNQTVIRKNHPEDSCLPQAIECHIFNENQINAGLLFLFKNEINVVKCADIIMPNKNAAIKNSVATTENFEKENNCEILSVIPR